jgi:hypothetical protein
VLFVLRVLVIAFVVAGAVQACRAIGARSRRVGWLVAAGLALRVMAGTALFALSATDAALLSAVHTGDGFWDLAPDARVYYGLAATVAAQGLDALPAGSPSPFYGAVLGLWLAGSGIHILNAVLFNALCYLATCVAIVFGIPTASPRTNRSIDSPLLLIVVGSITFSPLLVLTSTQVLKDSFFVLLIVVACVAVLNVFRLLQTTGEVAWGQVGAWIAVAATAQFGIAGVRAYYAALVCAAVAGGAAVQLWRAHGRRLRAAVTGAGLVITLWMAFMFGAGAYYVHYADLLERATGLSIPVFTRQSGESGPLIMEADVTALGDSVIALRRGFARSGGATNLTDREEDETASVRASEIAERTGIGLLAMLVPMTLLDALSIVDVAGGRGFLFVTDVDTVFATGMLIAAIVIAYRARARATPAAPGLVFACLLAGISALLMAYIVTNYGTLFRLRVIAIAPAWLLPLAYLGQGRGE